MSSKTCTRCEVDTTPAKLKGYRLQIDDGRKMSGSEVAVTTCPRCGQLYFWDSAATS